jgi:thiol-disulfide isomerase/thioredoxin
LVALVIVAVTTSPYRSTSRRAAGPAQLVGREAPSIDLPLHGGGTFDLKRERGRVVVLDFWATWCGTCIEAMPVVDEVTKRYEGRGVKLVTVNIDDTPERITRFAAASPLPGPVVLASETDVGAAYGAWSIPTIVVIDADGIVRFAGAMTAVDVRNKLATAIEAALAKSTPT